MTRALLIEPGAPLVFPVSHELEVMRIDARRVSTYMVRLVSGRDRSAVVDLPGDIMTAADFFPDTHERVAVLVDGSLPPPAAGRRLDAVAKEFLPKIQLHEACRLYEECK